MSYERGADATRPGHRIAEVSYSADRVVCTCGVAMTARDGRAWREHRLSVGLRTPTIGATTIRVRG